MLSISLPIHLNGIQHLAMTMTEEILLSSLLLTLSRAQNRLGKLIQWKDILGGLFVLLVENYRLCEAKQKEKRTV